MRWVFRLSDPGGGCLRRRLPGRLRGHAGRARLPGGGPPPAPPAERLDRAGLGLLARSGTVAGRLGRRGLARRCAAGRTRIASGRRAVLAGRPGTGCGGGLVLRRAVLIALGLPPAVLARLAVSLGLAVPGGRTVGPATVTAPAVVRPVHEDQQAAAIAAFARLGKCFEQPGAHPL